mgnify:FL=1
MFFTESGSNIGNATSLRGTDTAASFTVIPIHGEEMRCFSPQKTVKDEAGPPHDQSHAAGVSDYSGRAGERTLTRS